MPIFVDPKTGEKFENYEPDAAEKAAQFGLVTAEQYDAEQRSGDVGSQLQTAGEEVVRQAAGAASLIPGVDAGATPVGLTELEPGQEANPLTSVYSPEARERRAVNPVATGIGAAAPAVAAGIALPGSGLAGLAATLGVDALSGYSQAAVDAELENRDISGSDVLRNAGLNLAFSLPLYGLGEGARLALQGRRLSALERAASAAKDTAGRRAAAAEGADLAQAVADPAVQTDLLSRVQANADDAVARASEAMGGVSLPPVARNPRAQREAVGAIADVVRTTDPALATRLDDLTKGSARSRLKGLRALRDELAQAGESETLDALDATIGREDLWGSKAIRGAADVDSALGGAPGAGADPESLIEYAARLRKVRGGEFSAMADEIEQLAERQIEIRTASAIGDVTPAASNDVVDYAAAMRKIDPAEAWRLTHDGADDGLRRIEAASVSDALQRVDDTLKEDVAMSVKRNDFIKGAEEWTPTQMAAQQDWAAEMGVKSLELAAKLKEAKRLGYNIKGFGASATDLIERTAQRLTAADPVTANYEWDNLKRGLDSIVKRLGRAGDSVDGDSAAWGIRTILETADEMRNGLEDAALWGANAGLQKETNAAWVKLIEPYTRATKRMAEFLGREFGVVGQAGINRRFDPDMVESIMKGGYQRNLRSDIDEAIKGLDQMMVARQKQGLSRLDRLSQARADLVRIQQGFDFADLLAVAKGKAKAPIGLEIAGRIADNASPSGIIGSVAGPLAARARSAALEGVPMLVPGSKSPLAGAVRRHLGMTRSEQAKMLADPAFYERLPGSLQKQIMAGSAAGDRAVEMASAAADAAKRDREITARMMVNPEQAKRARKAQRKKPSPALERSRKRASQAGSVVVPSSKRSAIPLDDIRVLDKDGYLEPATPRQAKKHAAAIQDAAENAIAGKSLEELGALPLEGGESLKKVASFKEDRSFRETGMLSSNNDRGRGGLPKFEVDADGNVTLINGRHRLTAAKESGQETMVSHLQKVDANGDIVWDYVGPVRVSPPGAAKTAVSPSTPTAGTIDMGGRGRSAYSSPEVLRAARLAAEEHIYSMGKYLDSYDVVSWREAQARIKAGTASENDLQFELLKDEMFAAQGPSWSWTGQSIGRQSMGLQGYGMPDQPAAPAPSPTARSPRIEAPSGRSAEEQALRDQLQATAPGTQAYLKVYKKLEKLQKQRGTVVAGDRGSLDVSELAKSPLGIGTSAAGALVAYRHLGEPEQPDPETTGAMDRFAEGYEKPADAFRAARKMVLDWQRNPEALVDMVAGHMGDVGQLSPRLEREMTAQAMRIAGYLQDNLPGQRNVSVVYPDGTPPSRAEVRQFALRFDAAVNPSGVMADARMGRLERTQLDTLYALWPREYDALRAGVIEELGKGQATPQTRQRMSLLFGFGSEVDPALGPRTRAVVAAARAAQQEQAPAPSSPGMNRQRLPSTATMQPAGMAALSLGQQIGAP